MSPASPPFAAAFLSLLALGAAGLASAETLAELARQHFDGSLRGRLTLTAGLGGMGGASIFRVRSNDPNINVIIETLTQGGQQFTMAQRYLPEIKLGDKRVLLIDGKPIPFVLARIPKPGETRGNLAVGGRGVGQEISERDRWIASQVGPELKKRGILFAGLDVIGDFLTEVNVTSPTCIRELDAQFGINISAQLLDRIKEKLRP